jgi:hypothetical protein
VGRARHRGWPSGHCVGMVLVDLPKVTQLLDLTDLGPDRYVTTPVVPRSEALSARSRYGLRPGRADQESRPCRPPCTHGPVDSGAQ